MDFLLTNMLLNWWREFQCLCLLYRVSTLVPLGIKLNACYTLIFSRMSYVITVCGKSSIGNRNLFVNAQKRVWKVFYYNINDYIIANNKLLDYDSIFNYFTSLNHTKFFITATLNTLVTY